MNYKLNANENGMVAIIRKAGSAYVKTYMPEGLCIGLIERAEDAKSSDRWEGFGIVIGDDETYFEGFFTSDEKPAETGETDKKFNPKKR